MRQRYNPVGIRQRIDGKWAVWADLPQFGCSVCVDVRDNMNAAIAVAKIWRGKLARGAYERKPVGEAA